MHQIHVGWKTAALALALGTSLGLGACGDSEEEGDSASNNAANNAAANNHANHGTNNHANHDTNNSDANNSDANNALDNNATPQGSITLRFAARFGENDFACGQSYEGLGTSGATLTPDDLRLYVHNIRLVRADGSEEPLALTQDGAWQHEDLALLDFEDKSGPCSNGTTATRSEVTGEAAEGPYTGVRFTLGVPFELNHNDVTAAPSPLNLSGMFWSWNGGYKFLRLDTQEGFRIHLGSTGCQGEVGDISSCDHPNRAEYELTGFDPTTGTIVFDFASLLGGSDLSQNAPNTAEGCMSAPDDADCEPIFSRLGMAQPPQQFVFAE
jgi:uncharacterized repeat protein (TIGR04052 family)